MEKKRLRTITILFSKKNRNSQITNKNEINEKKENERKKKKKCNKNILRMYKKVYSFSIKYHANVIFY